MFVIMVELVTGRGRGASISRDSEGIPLCPSKREIFPNSEFFLRGIITQILASQDTGNLQIQELLPNCLKHCYHWDAALCDYMIGILKWEKGKVR